MGCCLVVVSVDVWDTILKYLSCFIFFSDYDSIFPLYHSLTVEIPAGVRACESKEETKSLSLNCKLNDTVRFNKISYKMFDTFCRFTNILLQYFLVFYMFVSCLLHSDFKLCIAKSYNKGGGGSRGSMKSCTHKRQERGGMWPVQWDRTIQYKDGNGGAEAITDLPEKWKQNDEARVKIFVVLVSCLRECHECEVKTFLTGTYTFYLLILWIY